MPKTTSLDATEAERLIRLLTDGLVNIVDETGEFKYTLPNGFVLDTKGWLGWEWTQGVALVALYHHYALNPTSSAGQHSKKVSLEWWEKQIDLTGGAGAQKNINTFCPLYNLAYWIEDGSVTNPVYSRWLEEFAQYDMSPPPEGLPKTKYGGFQHIHYLRPNTEELWDDTLFMSILPLTKAGLLFNRPEYIEEAKYQFLLHITYLMDTVTGLWYHGWKFEENGGHNFAKALWARGNSWITVAIPTFLELLGDKLPENDPIRRTLIATLTRQIDGLLPLQDHETGLWHTLLVEPESYLEASASAGFAAGIYAALRGGLITGDKYLACADRALHGVIASIEPDGQVANVSFGTGCSHDLDYYRKVPITSMPYGQALAMLMLVEWLRFQQSGPKA